LVGQLGYNKLQRYVFIIDDPNPGNFVSINCIPDTFTCQIITGLYEKEIIFNMFPTAALAKL